MQMVVSEPPEKLKESHTWDGPIYSGTPPSASGFPGPKKVIPTPIVTSPSPPQTLSPTGSTLTVNTPAGGGNLGGGLYDKNARFRRSSAVHLVATASGSCKKYRSKSVVSVDPQSPYYSARGVAGNASANGGFVTHGLHKAPTVSCVPGYDAKTSNVSRTGDPLADGLKRKASEAKNGQIPGLNLGLSPNDPKTSTIRQHYYPEGGWGWVICACALMVQILTCGLHYSYGYLIMDLVAKFKTESSLMEGVCLGALSTSIALFFSPVVVAICRRKSTRLLAVLGGLVSALGCLFTSFASQFHQLYLSYGIIVGVGVCITRDTSSLMVGQYFKKRREVVEIIISLGTGLGLSVMPLFLKECTSSIGWRLGLQAVTGLVFVTFILGVFYRPASLYHPQRRAILHLKSLQKRSKAKDKSAQHDKPPFFDFGVLKSRTVQILVCGVGLTAFGSHAPVMLLIYEGHKEGFSPHSLQLLQIFLGVAFTLGSGAFGFIVVKKSVQCMIARQYLFQAASFMLAASLLAFTALDAYNGYVLFVWIYGIFYGGYQYSLKMYTFEKVRARNFPRAWGFVQCSQAIPNLVGVPLTCYLNEKYGVKTGFYFASAFVFLGSLSLFLIDAHKKKLQRRKMSLMSDGRRCSDACFSRTFSRRSSFQDSIFGGRTPALSRTQQRSLTFSNYADLRRQELTCISEEVVMDNFMEDFMDDCITSCNREEKYLMLSEFENNLTKNNEVEGPTKRTFFRPFKRVSVLKTATPPNHCPNCMRHLPDIRSADMIIEEESGLRMSATEQTLAPVTNLVANATKNNNVVNSIPVEEDETREVTTMV